MATVKPDAELALFVGKATIALSLLEALNEIVKQYDEQKQNIDKQYAENCNRRIELTMSRMLSAVSRASVELDNFDNPEDEDDIDE